MRLSEMISVIEKFIENMYGVKKGGHITLMDII